jgi:hypothetical protein
VNEHSASASEDPPVPEDTQAQPASPAARSRRFPRAGLAAAAATSRTAGWIVAAGLGGSLITLLVGPGRNSSTTTIVPLHRAAFAINGAKSATPGRHVYIRGPVRQKIVGFPAGRPPAVGMLTPDQIPGPGPGWVQVPTMIPACGIPGPGALPPGPRIHGRAFIKGVITRPGKNGMRVEISRPGVPKRMIWVGRRGLRAHRISIQVPRRPLFAAGPGSFTFIGPGGPFCAVPMPGGPVQYWYSPGWSAPPPVSWYGR